ncbi:MAG: tyrosine-type recombinase/integrase [Planctomycetes bacterium]|nr:tyrosine-type recombinase/integrase [Planctomycetota bacterium]
MLILQASENLAHRPKTTAKSSMASNRKSFVDKAFGINARDNDLNRPWRRIVAEANTPIRIHDLRKTCVTRLLREGIDVKTVQTLAGHVNATTTFAFYAVAPTSAETREAVNRLAAASAAST